MQNNDMNSNQSSKGSGNMSNTGTSNRNMSSDQPGSGTLNTDKIKNQSDQQRRSSMDDGTPEMQEKNLKKDNLTDEELYDVDWNTSKSENK
jgi:hypothetical protein